MSEQLPKAIIWDMDGVIVDSGRFHFYAWQQALAEHGFSFTEAQFRQTFGQRNREILLQFLGDRYSPELEQAISERKEALFRENLRGKAQPLPGVLTWLDRLKAQGFRHAVASSGPSQNIEAVIGELGLGYYFDAIVCGESLPAGKPDPTIFLHAAEMLDTPPSRCVVIEDAVAGVEAAHRAGMKCVAVTTTNRPEALRNAEIVVARLNELPPDTFERLIGS